MECRFVKERSDIGNYCNLPTLEVAARLLKHTLLARKAPDTHTHKRTQNE